MGQPFTHVYPSGSLILTIWKRHAPIQSSDNKTSLSSFQCSFSFASWHRRIPMGLVNVVSSGMKQPSPDVLRVGVYEVATVPPKVISVFFCEKCPLLLFHLAQGFTWRAFRRVRVEEDRKVWEIRLQMVGTAFLLVRLHGA